MDTFVGKFLIRRVKQNNGVDAFVICGSAIPDNFQVTDIKDNDEMWVARLGILDINKYEQASAGSTGFHGSPEDFLAQMPDTKSPFCEWKKKT